MTAETWEPDADELDQIRLQWSRGLLTAETRIPYAPPLAVMLQWSRGLLTAETRRCNADTAAAAGFNGAAVF